MKKTLIILGAALITLVVALFSWPYYVLVSDYDEYNWSEDE